LDFRFKGGNLSAALQVGYHTPPIHEKALQWTSMKTAFLILTGLLFVQPLGSPVDLRTASFSRADLPDDFPFQALYENFAVIQVTISNNSKETWSFEPDDLQVFAPGGKKLKRALPTQITPKLIKYYKGNQAGIHGEIYAGGRPPYNQRQQTPTIEPSSRPRSYSISIPERIREILEYYELKPAEIEPGQRVEGFLYLKSKKHGTKLSGGKAALGGVSAVIP
jgi:hypothetical protein